MATMIDSPMTPAQRNFTEKALAYAEFIRNNRLYAFREATADERLVEAAVGEQLFWPPNPKQKELLDGWLDPTKKVFTFFGGNRGGKTTILIIISLSVMFGRWLWNDTPIVFPHKRYQRRKVRIIGQAWESQIKAVLVPKLKEWWPKNRPLDTKKNNQGVEYLWKDLATGSTLEIMSNSQTSDVMEGEDNDLIGYDEPPERDNRIACARGLMDRGGRELFAATLIKQAWIHREVIKARLPDGKPDMSIFNVMVKTRDNIGFGLTEIDVADYAKKLKPDEVESRIEGKPSYLQSLVFPRFSRDLHVKPWFRVPLDAIVDISIDFHPSKKWAVVFMATFKNGYKYVCREMWEHGNPKAIAEEIVRVIRNGNFRVGRCIIDPLAKSGEPNDSDVYTIMGNVLGAHNISLDVASKDKSNGIALVNNLLWTENQMPGLWVFDSCPMTIKQIEDLMYDPETLKDVALKVDDDFCECLQVSFVRYSMVSRDPVRHETAEERDAMKWKAACLELLDYTIAHTNLGDDIQEFADEVWGCADVLEIYAAYLKRKKNKVREVLTMRKADEQFRRAWAVKNIGNDLRTPEGRAAYMKVAEEEAQP